MNWFKKLLGYKEDPGRPVPEPINVVQPESDLTVTDYPGSQYKVYWETFLFENSDGSWSAEVRFIGYAGTNILETHSVIGISKDNVQSLANKLIKDKMEDFKWH